MPKPFYGGNIKIINFINIMKGIIYFLCHHRSMIICPLYDSFCHDNIKDKSFYDNAIVNNKSRKEICPFKTYPKQIIQLCEVK